MPPLVHRVPPRDHIADHHPPRISRTKRSHFHCSFRPLLIFLFLRVEWISVTKVGFGDVELTKFQTKKTRIWKIGSHFCLDATLFVHVLYLPSCEFGIVATFHQVVT